MNLYLRLIWILITTSFKTGVSVLGVLETRHRVWPNDLDIFVHMNNSRYFAISDLARMEVLLRTGLWSALKKRKLYPVIAGETIQFRKPLLPFQKYSIITKLLGWDEKFLYIEHTFRSGHNLHAVMLAKVRVIGNDSTRISPQQVLKFVSSEYELQNLEPIQVDSVIEKWNESSRKHWVDVDQLGGR